jgi:hypothetical protein
MTQVVIDDIIPRTQLIASGGQTVFNTNWTVNATTDVLVYARADGVPPNDVTQLVSPSLYNVTLVGGSETVRVTFLSGRTLGDVITIVRNTPAERLNLYTNTNFVPSMLNNDFGILTLVDQQAQMYDTRVAPRYNVSATIEDVVDTVLPILEAGQIWVMNATRTGIEAIEYQSGGGGGAPTDATYILQEPNVSLPNAQALDTLDTGFMFSTTLTGVVGTREFEGTVHQVDVINGSGLAGNPVFSISSTLNLPGTFNIQSSTAIDEIINDPTMATSTTTNISTSAAIKSYIDSLVVGLNIKGSCVAGTTGALTANYSNGASGVGASLTNAGAQAAFAIDGVSPSVGQRVLIKNQASSLQNGIYTVTDVGSGATDWVLTRATDYDTGAEINPGDLVILTGGTTQTNSSWMQTANVVTIGTDPITFVQFTASLPMNVASGGTGVTSFTAYALIAGGTTSTGSLQSLGTGNSGDILRSGGNAALPSFGAGAALTRTDDTNVTLTLGGSPSTALVNAASLTLGWTGLLAKSRGGTGVSAATTTPTADEFVGWDSNKNIYADNFISSLTSTATAAGTTTLTVDSTYIQEFTGSTTQTVTLPVVSTLTTGHSFLIINNSSGNVTVNSSGGNAIQVMSANTSLLLTCVLTTGTTADSWNASYLFDAGGGVTSISGTANQISASAATGNVTLSLTSNQIVTDWVAYTPTFTGFGTVSDVQIYSKRIGDTLFIRGRFQGGTTTATEARITLGYNGTNANVTSSNTVISSIQQAGGFCIFGYNSTPVYQPLIEANVGYLTFGVQSGASTGLTKINGNDLLLDNNVMSFTAQVPIASFP